MNSRIDDDAVSRSAACLLSLAALVMPAIAGTPAAAVIAGVFVAALIAVWSPPGVLGASVVALPWFYHPLGVGSQGVAASETLLLLAAAGYAARLAVAALRERGLGYLSLKRLVRTVTISRLVWASAALALTGLLLVVWPFDPTHRSESLREWRWTLAEPLLLVSILVGFGDRRTRTWVGICLIVGGTAAAAAATVDLASGGGIATEGVRRANGPFPHPNALALYVERGFAFAAAWLVFDRDNRYRAWLIPIIAISGLGVVLTYSRGAYAACVVALILVASIGAPRWRFAVLGGVAVAGSALVTIASNRMLDVFNGGSGSLRLDIWRSSLAMIRDRPISGYGPDQFLYSYAPRYIVPQAWNERFTSHAHNVLLDFWLRLGIIGAVFAPGATWVCARSLYRAARAWGTMDPLRGAALVALAAALVHGMVDQSYFAHDLAMSAWLLAWIAFSTRQVDAG